MHLLFLGVTRIRYLEPEVRSFVAALLAGIVGLFVLWIAASTTATAPFSPYLWFAGGALSYWLATTRSPRPLLTASRPH
jgi:multisubunit Na+/H+ antiporter MnhB subunit